MANLFNRIFDLSDKQNFIETTAKLPIEVQEIQAEPSLEVSIPKSKRKGGASQEERLEHDHMDYFQRWNVFLLIFLISIFLAILTMKNKIFINKILKQKKVEDLSKGMQQKAQFIATILHEPALLILDEPFSGLDPINANLIKDEIIALKEKGIIA
jgi:ABC-type bacteriocin/lantibiotic exporter with double-glycine peptidase domain